VGEAARVYAIVERTDNLHRHGDALMDLAEILEVVGQHEEAALAVGRAHELYARKGNLVSAENARRVLAGLTDTPN
jgi:hypothetical protein